MADGIYVLIICCATTMSANFVSSGKYITINSCVSGHMLWIAVRSAIESSVIHICGPLDPLP